MSIASHDSDSARGFDSTGGSRSMSASSVGWGEVPASSRSFMREDGKKRLSALWPGCMRMSTTQSPACGGSVSASSSLSVVLAASGMAAMRPWTCDSRSRHSEPFECPFAIFARTGEPSLRLMPSARRVALPVSRHGDAYELDAERRAPYDSVDGAHLAKAVTGHVQYVILYSPRCQQCLARADTAAHFETRGGGRGDGHECTLRADRTQRAAGNCRPVLSKRVTCVFDPFFPSIRHFQPQKST